MTTAYNLLNKLYQAKQSGRAERLDPGANKDIIVGPVGDSNVVISSTGNRTLQDATTVPLGTRITAYSTAAGAEVESVALAAGQFAVFIVILDASGNHTWTQENLAQ